MGSQIQKCWVKLFSSTRVNYCFRLRQSITCRLYQTAPHRRHVLERELSTLYALPVSRTQIDENTDEFDEEYIYDFPADVPREAQARICEIMEEMEVSSRFHFHQIPSHLSSENWTKLLEFDNANQRRKYCTHLYYKEKKRELKRKQAENKRLLRNEWEQKPVEVHKTYNTDDVVPYRFCTIFNVLNLFKKQTRIENLRVMKSAIFGPHIIVDCSYESHMIGPELDSCVRQLAMTRKSNRSFYRPFNIIHCNVDVNGPIAERLAAFIPNFMDPANTFHYTEKSFMDLFPREKLIYLSPHSDTELQTYDHDSVYIVGALVDHIPKVGLSAERAHLHGIKTVKFPLDRYMNWCKGTKCLMLFQAVNIMHYLREGVPWKEILSNNIQFTKTTFSGTYWQEPACTKDPLAIKYVNHFVEHRPMLEKHKR